MYFIFLLSISDFSNKAMPQTYELPLVQIRFLEYKILYFYVSKMAALEKDTYSEKEPLCTQNVICFIYYGGDFDVILTLLFEVGVLCRIA